MTGDTIIVQAIDRLAGAILPAPVPIHDSTLPHLLHLKVGCRVMLRTNLSIQEGLVNGAVGTLCGQTANGNLQIQFASQMSTIARITGTIVTDRGSVQRSMFPVILATAMTVHKSQGLTLDK